MCLSKVVKFCALLPHQIKVYGLFLMGLFFTDLNKPDFNNDEHNNDQVSVMNIFITGASSGIGTAIVLAYAKKYHASDVNFGLLGRDSVRLQALKQQLTSQNHTAQHQYQVNAVDVRDATAMHLAAQQYITAFGAPNIVIANAGVSRGTLTELQDDVKAFQAIFDINVMGVVHTFQPFITVMKQAAKHGELAQLIGIASVAGIRGLPGSGAYSASKSAVITYCESLRAEMQHYNIAVSTIAPGYIRTPMTALNHYAMPFLTDADVFATKLIKAVDRKTRYQVIPWQMGVVARIMRFIPACLWDRLMKSAPHKKRIDWDWL